MAKKKTAKTDESKPSEEAAAAKALGGAAGSSVLSFRLSNDDAAAWAAKVEASGLSKSEFFRLVALTNRTQVVAKAKKSADAKRLLYLANKAGNNLNQLAHRANADHADGKIDARTYSDILYQLQRINRYFKFMLAHAD